MVRSFLLVGYLPLVWAGPSSLNSSGMSYQLKKKLLNEGQGGGLASLM